MNKDVKQKMPMMIFPVKLEGLAFDEKVPNTQEIQVLQVGSWKHPVYGNIKISEKDLDEFVKNFESDVRRDLAITEGHPVGDEELPAVGWFKQLINKGRDGLWAVIEWTKEGKALLEGRAYKYFSPEFYDTYEDPEDHKVYKKVLVGGALTNRPYFKGLQAVMLSEQTLNKEMNLEEILLKKAEELSDEEKAFVKENRDKLTDEQKTSFKDLLEEGEEKEEKKKEEATTEEKKEEALGEEKVQASESVMISKEILGTLERNAEEGVRAMAELRRQKADTYVSSMMFSESNKFGPLLPKSKDKVVDFLLSLSEKQQESFRSILAEMPKGKMFSELGSESGASVKASEQIQSLVSKKMSENSDLTYRQALEQVFSENSELAKRAENE